MFEWINQLISQAMGAITQGDIGALTAVFFVTALTECGIPFPFILDSVLFFSSYDAGQISGEVLLVLLVVFLGRQAGAGAIYWLARLMGNAFIEWMSRRFKALRGNIAELGDRLSHHAVWAVAVIRLTGLLTLASVGGGAIGMRYYHFVLGVTLSAVIFDGSLITLGLVTQHWFSNIGFKPATWHIIAGFILLMTIIWIIQFCVSRRKSHKKRKAEACSISGSEIGE